MSGWISVVGWRKFQHYDPSKRAPIWVKNYTDLMDNDDYLDLTAHQRAVLHGIWLAYASSRCQLRVNTASLSSRLHLRVTSRQLESLVHAGWIDIVASKSLADGYQDASPEVEVEKDLEQSVSPSSSTYTQEDGRTEDELEGLETISWPTEAELADLDRDQHGVPLHLLRDMPAA